MFEADDEVRTRSCATATIAAVTATASQRPLIRVSDVIRDPPDVIPRRIVTGLVGWESFDHDLQKYVLNARAWMEYNEEFRNKDEESRIPLTHIAEELPRSDALLFWPARYWSDENWESMPLTYANFWRKISCFLAGNRRDVEVDPRGCNLCLSTRLSYLNCETATTAAAAPRRSLTQNPQPVQKIRWEKESFDIQLKKYLSDAKAWMAENNVGGFGFRIDMERIEVDLPRPDTLLSWPMKYWGPDDNWVPMSVTFSDFWTRISLLPQENLAENRWDVVVDPRGRYIEFRSI